LRLSNRSTVLNYAYFQTVCRQNNASVEWSYFAQKCTKFHPQPPRCEKFSRGKTLFTEVGVEGRKGIKIFLPLKGRGDKGGKG